MGFVSPRGPKKPLSPVLNQLSSGPPTPALAPPGPSNDLGAVIPSKPVLPAKFTVVLSPRPPKALQTDRFPCHSGEDREVIELIASDTDSSSEFPPPVVRPSPKKKGPAITRVVDSPGPGPSTPTKGKGKARKPRGPATPTSPAGKKLTGAAKARLLEHYASELFDDLNSNVFDGLLDSCEIVWSKLLSSTAGKAFLTKQRDENGRERLDEEGKIVYSLKIELSKKVVDSEERIRNTLSHEMCHLSTWLSDGVGVPDHGSAWKTWANRVTRYRSDIEITTRHDYEIAYKFSWQCTNGSCGQIHGRFSKSIDIKVQGCGICRSRLKPLFDATPKKKTPWQEFMKEHMGSIKRENPGISQSAAMQLLAERWKRAKEATGSGDLDDVVAGGPEGPGEFINLAFFLHQAKTAQPVRKGPRTTSRTDVYLVLKVDTNDQQLEAYDATKQSTTGGLIGLAQVTIPEDVVVDYTLEEPDFPIRHVQLNLQRSKSDRTKAGLVSLYFSPTFPIVPPHTAPSKAVCRHVRITAICAKYLRSVNRGDHISDPSAALVVSSDDKELLTTKAVEALSPTWNEHVETVVNPQTTFNFRVYDTKDQGGSQGGLLGFTAANVRDMVDLTHDLNFEIKKFRMNLFRNESSRTYAGVLEVYLSPALQSHPVQVMSTPINQPVLGIFDSPARGTPPALPPRRRPPTTHSLPGKASWPELKEVCHSDTALLPPPLPPLPPRPRSQPSPLGNNNVILPNLTESPGSSGETLPATNDSSSRSPSPNNRNGQPQKHNVPPVDTFQPLAPPLSPTGPTSRKPSADAVENDLSATLASSSQDARPLGPLPQGWEVRHTVYGEAYFVDHTTKTTTWNDPRFAVSAQKKSEHRTSGSFTSEGATTTSKKREPSRMVTVRWAVTAINALKAAMPPTIVDITADVESVGEVAVASGGTCDVYKGVMHDGQVIALKRPRRIAMDEDQLRRFNREAETWNKLRHRAILRFLGTCQRNGEMCLVMPWSELGDASLYVKHHPSLTYAVRKGLLCDVADGLAYLHEHQVVHGDLKLANVVLGSDMEGLICDFGFSKGLGVNTSDRSFGTVRWTAPEVLNGKHRTPASDMFAYSMCVVETITGIFPFPNTEAPGAVILKIVRGERPDPLPETSPDGHSFSPLWDLARDCWCHEPNERITAQQVFHRLKEGG
ncbi:hypothetical protein FRB99_006838 [Tulasnella sp. 403]|nr:hypothetical protein FRB99_006838 [Tulasnella sp. 403]